jgi:hypothetical protein
MGDHLAGIEALLVQSPGVEVRHGDAGRRA